MTWVLVDVAIALVALALLALSAWELYRRVRWLGRDVSAAGARVAEVQTAVAALSDSRRASAPGAAPAAVRPASAQARGVRSARPS